MKLKKLLALPLLCAGAIASASAQSSTDSSGSVPVAPLTRVRADAWGASVIRIDSAEIAQSTAPTFSELLQARRPGVRVFRSGGTASDGALVMLRGPTSVSGTNEPLLIIDGIRVDARQYDLALYSGTSVAPTRLDDLAPEDIDRIEVLSGPAAALYGEGASNGAIVVTTKSGDGGPLRLSGRVTWDASKMPAVFPANYGRSGVVNSSGTPTNSCSLLNQANGFCTPTQLNSWNPLEQASPFRVGNSARAHLEMSGKPLGTSIYAAVTADERQGTLPHDEGSRLGVRAKVRRLLPAHLSVEAVGSWLRDDARLDMNGNIATASNVIGAGLLGDVTNDANRGYNTFGTPGDSIYPDQRIRHATLGVTLGWQPVPWLDAAVMTGDDRVIGHWRNDQVGPVTNSSFTADTGYERNVQRTTGARLSASYHAGAAIGGTTELGWERADQRTTAPLLLFLEGNNPFLGAFRDRSTSFRVGEHVSVFDQLFATVAAQRLSAPVFNQDRSEWFPSANVSWTVPVRSAAVSDVRLRAAYADAAGSMSSLWALSGFVPFPQQRPLKMERTREEEVGLEATLGGAAHVSATAFRSRSTHLWVANELPPPGIYGCCLGGFDAQYAEMINSGLETSIATPLLVVRDIRWTGSLSLALLHNRVSSLIGPPEISAYGRIEQGYPLGGIWTVPYTYEDANQDGLIASNEVVIGQGAQYAGPALPTIESAFETEIELPGHIAFTAHFDYRGGNRVVNFTEAERCKFSICRDAVDPATPLDEQAAAVAAHQGPAGVEGYTRDAAFLRVREIAVHWTLPSQWSGPFGATPTITVAGRNIATWTNYPGLDPEVNSLRPSGLPRQEFLIPPLPRVLVVRLDIGRRD